MVFHVGHGGTERNLPKRSDAFVEIRRAGLDLPSLSCLRCNVYQRYPIRYYKQESLGLDMSLLVINLLLSDKKSNGRSRPALQTGVIDKVSIFKSRSYGVTRGKYGKRIEVRTCWSEDIENYIKKKHVVELELNRVKGWQGNNLSFLKNLNELLVFELIDWKIEDISEITELSRLRALKVNTYCKTEIDFSCFPDLEEVSLEWQSKMKSLFHSTNLKYIFINGYKCKNKDLSEFNNLENIETLNLKSPSINSIGNISKLDKLRVLCISNARSINSLEGIEHLIKLRRLEINKCRSISDIEPLTTLVSLEHLEICDNGEIRSLRPITDLKNLKEVYFYETTNILDGDITPLIKLPKLSDTAFQERKHYNLNRSDLERHIQSKGSEQFGK